MSAHERLAGAQHDLMNEHERLAGAQHHLMSAHERLAGAQHDLLSARERLAGAQQDLLRALVAGGPGPEGFDPERLRVQANSLIAKRRGLVASAVPAAVATLGADFARLFFEYADGRPKPAGGSRADAREFVAWLRAQGLLPEQEPPPARQRRWRRKPR